MELELKSTRHEEARAYLIQARDFFEAAERAASTARPLLLYYAFLNLAKTLIKARNPTLDLTNAFHGQKENPANRQAQRFRLTSQEVEIENARANKAHVLNEFASAIGWRHLPGGNSFNVCELLAQVPSIHRAFSHVRHRAERLHHIVEAEFRFDQGTRELWSVIWFEPAGGKDSNSYRTLRSRNYFTTCFELVESDKEGLKLPTLQTEPVHYAQNPRTALHQLGRDCVQAGVCSILTGHGYRYYLSDVQPAIRVHQALAAYISMFYFGSVARYRPHDLEKTLNGPFAWAIEEFLTTEGRQFVYFIANCLLNREVARPLAHIA